MSRVLPVPGLCHGTPWLPVNDFNVYLSWLIIGFSCVNCRKYPPTVWLPWETIHTFGPIIKIICSVIYVPFRIRSAWIGGNLGGRSLWVWVLKGGGDCWCNLCINHAEIFHSPWDTGQQRIAARATVMENVYFSFQSSLSAIFCLIHQAFKGTHTHTAQCR